MLSGISLCVRKYPGSQVILPQTCQVCRRFSALYGGNIPDQELKSQEIYAISIVLVKYRFSVHLSGISRATLSGEGLLVVEPR